MAGIYVHIPFCSQACYYCDFHFSTSLRTKQRVINSINKELILQKGYLKSQLIKTIYFGGGTPSLIDLDSLQSIMKTIGNNFRLAKELEITIEANPEDIKEETLLSWSNIGFNRISLGVQALNDKHLEYMNRIHSVKQAEIAIKTIQKSKIKNFSIDLIYGYPLLKNQEWIYTLQQILKLKVPHISCYCLSVEKSTPLYFFIKKGTYKKLSSETGKQQFLITRKILVKNGYDHYEISNFAQPGYRSLHNTSYWNKIDYLGVGPSAHSFNGTTRQWNLKNNIKYCEMIEQDMCFYEKEELNYKNLINEYILTRLRTKEGFNKKYLKDQMNNLEFKQLVEALNKLECKKLIKQQDSTVVLTEEGMLVADSISENLFLI